jgi:hypothetical protein
MPSGSKCWCTKSVYVSHAVRTSGSRTAVAQRPDLRLDGALAGERVARKGGAVVVQPDHLAQVGGHGLSRGHLVDLARRDPQRAIGAKEQATGELESARGPLRVAPDDLEVGQRAAAGGERQLGSRDCAARPARAAFGVADINKTVVGVFGVQGDVVETALTGIGDSGRASDGALGLGGRVDDTQVAFPLGDEDAVVGQEGKRPWFGEVGNGCRLERLLASVQMLRRDGQSTRHKRQSVGDKESEMHHCRGGCCFPVY